MNRIASTVTKLETFGVKAFGSAVDVSDSAALQDFIHEAAETLDGIDMYIANASSLAQGNSEAHWRAGFESDVLGVVRAAEVLIPYPEAAVSQKGDASFLTISLMAATQVATVNAYSGMKAALTNLTKGLSREYAVKRIRFNTISPGAIYDEDGSVGRLRISNPDFYNALLEMNPLGRMGVPIEIAAMAAFLSSPVSSFTTGANVIIDGSMSTRVHF